MTTPASKTDQSTQDQAAQPEPVHKFSPARHPVFFSEGASQLAVGYPMSRLVFDSHPAQVSKDGNEVIHFIATEVVLPTNSLAQLAKQILESLIENKDQFDNAGADWNKSLRDLITQLQHPTPQPE